MSVMSSKMEQFVDTSEPYKEQEIILRICKEIYFLIHVSIEYSNIHLQILHVVEFLHISIHKCLH